MIAADTLHVVNMERVGKIFMKLYDLKTLHMKRAFGIDRVPYFSWKLQSAGVRAVLYMDSDFMDEYGRNGQRIS